MGEPQCGAHGLEASHKLVNLLWHRNILQFSSIALCSLNLQFCPFTMNKGDPATGLASWLLLRSCPYRKYDEQMENLCVCHTSKEVN